MLLWILSDIVCTEFDNNVGRQQVKQNKKVGMLPWYDKLEITKGLENELKNAKLVR